MITEMEILCKYKDFVKNTKIKLKIFYKIILIDLLFIKSNHYFHNQKYNIFIVLNVLIMNNNTFIHVNQ